MSAAGPGAPEFSRPLRIDAIGDAERTVDLAAGPAECAALAARFGLVAVDRLAATARVRRHGDIVDAAGSLSAAVVQACVATGDPLPAAIDTEFQLRFVPAGSAASAEEIELSAADLDVIEHAGGAIDLGEAVAETLALALDPFPRSPDAAATLRAAGVLSEDEVAAATGPFAALKGLLKP